LIEQIKKFENQKVSAVKLPKSLKDYKDFGKFFLLSIDYFDNLEQIKEKINNLNKKMDTVKEEIASLKPNDKNLLTLQLQYAFYKRSLNLYKNKLSIDKKALDDATKLIIDSIKTVYVDKTEVINDINNTDSNISKLKDRIEKVNIDIERLNLLNKDSSKLSSQIEKFKKSIKRYKKNKLADTFLLFGAALQEKNSKEAFGLGDKISDLASSILVQDAVGKLNDMIGEAEKKYLGDLEVIKGQTRQEIENTVFLFWKKINDPLFNINGIPISIFKLSLSIFIFLLGFLVGAFYKHKIKSISKMSNSSKTLLANLGYYLLILIAFFISLKVLGVNLSSFAIVAGALSVGIGFGLQNIISNFISGIIIMFERSLKIGDYIEFSEDLRGRVSDIRMRSTTITTNDNIDVVVPNKDLIENRVINWTMNDRIRRFKIPFGVAYGTDAHKVVEVVLDAVKNSGFADIYHDKYRITRVIMTEMGNSSVDFELFVWIKGEEILYPKRTTSKFLILIYDALNKNGIEIPFPQQDLHIRSIDATIPIEIKEPK